MRCEGFGIVLTGYLDGELAPGPRQRVRRHLQVCGACRHELAELEGLRAELGTIEFAELEDAELERYWNGIRRDLVRGRD